MSNEDPRGTYFAEDDLLPLSGLQHLLYCDRRCALVQLERVWKENRYTAEGRILHERVDEGTGERRGDLRIARGLALRSFRLGLVGRADVVEFHRSRGGGKPAAVVPGLEGRWWLLPVEYKRGKHGSGECYEVQLCAQALCLEEMLGVEIPEGALFYGQRRRRTAVAFDRPLRALTEETAARLHRLIGSRQVPAAVYGRKCKGCSLISICLPRAPRRSARAYLDELTG